MMQTRACMPCKADLTGELSLQLVTCTCLLIWSNPPSVFQNFPQVWGFDRAAIDPKQNPAINRTLSIVVRSVDDHPVRK